MNNTVKKLALIKSNEGSVQVSPITGIAERWQDSEKQLAKLYALESEHFEGLAEARSAANDTSDLFSQLEAVERVQRNLLKKLIATPASNRQDVVTKLEIWKQIVAPANDDSTYANPTDLLVCSVLSDFVRNMTPVEEDMAS